MELTNLEKRPNGDYLLFRSTGEAGKYIEVRVHYMKTDNLSRRGVYVTVTPQTITDGIVQVVLLSWADTLVLRTARFNPKHVLAVATLFDGHAPKLATVFQEGGREATQQVLSRLAELLAPVMPGGALVDGLGEPIAGPATVRCRVCHGEGCTNCGGTGHVRPDGLAIKERPNGPQKCVCKDIAQACPVHGDVELSPEHVAKIEAAKAGPHNLTEQELRDSLARERGE